MWCLNDGTPSDQHSYPQEQCCPLKGTPFLYHFFPGQMEPASSANLISCLPLSVPHLVPLCALGSSLIMADPDLGCRPLALPLAWPTACSCIIKLCNLPAPLLPPESCPPLLGCSVPCQDKVAPHVTSEVHPLPSADILKLGFAK